ncbi:PEP-CTERM sorting domain-containing protein [Stieleria marina]|uniref:PEP-CTERM sorting domain-containing protein n=1 Tax=Stieleria marina TaxID=1930275 RepID=UPI003AF34DCB
MLIALATNNANAAIVINIDGSSTAPVPTMGTTPIDVAISYTISAPTDNIAAMNLSFDLVPLGTALPTGVTFNSLTGLTDMSTDYSFSITPVADNDFLVTALSDAGAGATVSPGTFDLFTLTFDVDSSAADGFYGLRIDDAPNTTFFTAVGNAGVIPISATTTGGFTLTAVPEPSSFAICGLLLGAVTMRRRRRSKA